MVKKISERNESEYSTIKKQMAEGEERAKSRYQDEYKGKKVKFVVLEG